MTSLAIRLVAAWWSVGMGIGLFAASSRPVQAANGCGIAAINETIRQNPGDANAYVTRAACVLKPSGGGKPAARDVHAAIADLQRALELDPQNYYAHHNYGHAAYLIGSAAFAVDEFTKAIALNAKGARSYLGRGWARSDLCQLKEMTADFAQAVKLDRLLQDEVASAQRVAQQRIECTRPAGPGGTLKTCPEWQPGPTTPMDLRFWYEIHYPSCPGGIGVRR